MLQARAHATGNVLQALSHVYVANGSSEARAGNVRADVQHMAPPCRAPEAHCRTRLRCLKLVAPSACEERKYGHDGSAIRCAERPQQIAEPVGALRWQRTVHSRVPRQVIARGSEQEANRTVVGTKARRGRKRKIVPRQLAAAVTRASP